MYYNGNWDCDTRNHIICVVFLWPLTVCAVFRAQGAEGGGGGGGVGGVRGGGEGDKSHCAASHSITTTHLIIHVSRVF